MDPESVEATAAVIAQAAVSFLVELARLDTGHGVIVDDDLDEAALVDVLAAQPGLIDRHRALGSPPGWHVMVLPRGRALAAATLESPPSE